MTKEKLAKEATEYALEWGDKTDGTYACCRDGYLAGAEPREKRIAELEMTVGTLRTFSNEQAIFKRGGEMTFTEYLNKNCKTYKMKITSMELGFLHSVLSRYIEDENNKDRGIDIANMIKEKVDKIIAEIYRRGK